MWNFTEDKYGNVWAGEYTDYTVSTGAHLWRRRPSGAWTNVANWTSENHIHQVYYDPFRDALYVAVGDHDHGILKLPSNKIDEDGISASDFSFILTTDGLGNGVEITAMTSDANYIYGGMDLHSSVTDKSRALVRITDDDITQSLEYIYPLTQCTVWSWAHVDDNGVIIFGGYKTSEFTCASNDQIDDIVASDDYGATWQVVKANVGASFTGLPSYYATNWSGLYGLGNNWGGKYNPAIVGRVLRANQTFYVDGANGVDWTNFGITQSRPVKTLNYLELLDIQPGDTIRFVGTNTYSSPLIAGWSGNGISKISLLGNTTSIFSGGNAANTPAVAETFESVKGSWNFTLGEAGGSITADTSIFYEGAQSAKIVRGASGTTYMSLKNVATTNINEGDTMYLSYWFYYPTDQTSSSDQNMLRILDNSSFEFRLKLSDSTVYYSQNEIFLNAPQTSNWHIPSRKSLTSGNWHKMYIEDYLHSTSGSFKMYIDNQLWLNVNGVKTVTAGGKLNAIYFYAYENPITFYIDDFKFGKLPFDSRGAINTNDYNYLDIGNLKIQGINGALLSSNTTNVDLHDSIFNGLTSDAVISSGSASLNYYYNTIFGSGRYGFNAASSATLKNNVVYNSTTNDVFIGASATLTGNNNWFKDSVKGGTGTYTDAGSTTWSGADPAFVNSGIGDFHLLSSSPLINTGTTVTGFTSDFASTIRPQGSAPDIGAYEYIPLTVTINQKSGQADPTKDSPINFTVVFSESVSDFATGDVTLSGTAGATTATVTGSGITYNVAVTGMTGSGTVIASILADEATGATGNTNAASTNTDNIVTYDITAPAISSVSSTPTSSGSTITWVANEDSSSKVDYGLTTSYSTSTTETDTSIRVQSHSVSLSGLVSCSTYYYRVRSKDSAGNEATSDNTFVTTGTCPTSVPSTLQGSTTLPQGCSDTKPGVKAPWLYGAIAQDSNSVLLYFTANDSPINKYVLEYGTKSGNYPYGVLDMGVNSRGSMTFLVKSLLPNTTYYFKVRGGNGCATGPWSNEISSKTKSLFSTNNLEIVSSELNTVNNPTPISTQKPKTNGSTHGSTPTKIPTPTPMQNGYSVKVKVINKDKKPIEGATVTLHSNPQTAKTDKEGIAEFKNVEQGEHKVIIAYNNFKGEQTVNLTGDVKGFELNVTVKEENVLLSPQVMGLTGFLVLIIVILGIVLIRLKKKR